MMHNPVDCSGKPKQPTAEEKQAMDTGGAGSNKSSKKPKKGGEAVKASQKSQKAAVAPASTSSSSAETLTTEDEGGEEDAELFPEPDSRPRPPRAKALAAPAGGISTLTSLLVK